MLNAAKHWVLSHKAWFVRLLLLALPWQTRWFVDGPALNGYPWEYGRVSVYASWFLIALGLIACKPWKKDNAIGKKALPLLLLALLLTTVFTQSPIATFSWWLTTLAALLVFVVVRYSDLKREEAIFWFSLGLAPHILLGLGQVMYQLSPAFSWLGLAAHDPATLGTSVVEWSGGRFLRAYGGFPHPNIFGGWLALVVVLNLGQKLHLPNTRQIGLFLFAASAGAALGFSFSRSAWLAVFLGVAFSVSSYLAVLGLERLDWFADLVGWRAFRPGRDGLRFLVALCVGAAVMCALAWPVVTTRFLPQMRLEAQSIDQRSESLRNGLELLRRHPWVGVGFGATTPALMQDGLWPNDPTAGPPEPPHNVPLLALVEMGTLPFALFLVAAWLFVRQRRPVVWSAVPWGILASLMPLLLLDHYLWTLWPGKALFTVALAILFLPALPLDETPKTATMA